MGCCLISAARLKGKTHQRCDDKLFFHRDKDIVISALADGAGSKTMSSVGAKIATKTISKEFSRLIAEINISSKTDFLQSAENLKSSIVLTIKNAIENSKDFTGDISEYACTLLFSVYIKKCERWIIGHIGDGVICSVDYNNSLNTVSEPENGEFANETFFITADDAVDRLRLYIVKGIRGVVLATDGTAASIYSKDGVALGLLNFFKWQMELGESKASSILKKNIKQVFLKKSNDDCSILLHQLKNIDKTEPRIKITKITEEKSSM